MKNATSSAIWADGPAGTLRASGGSQAPTSASVSTSPVECSQRAACIGQPSVAPASRAAKSRGPARPMPTARPLRAARPRRGTGRARGSALGHPASPGAAEPASAGLAAKCRAGW